ncbi:MAG: IS3 family transposase [Bacteroidales bacterium]|nr:IS3 family transposase [Bacteroidales bacterium]
MEESSYKYGIIQATLDSDDGENMLSVGVLCELAGVSRSGYYAWLKAEPIREAQEAQDRADFELILEAYNVRGYSKGAKSIKMRLLRLDPPVKMSLKKIRRLMHKFHLVCPMRKANPYRKIAKANQEARVAENILQREFEDYGPRMVLLTDITYLRYNGTFAYMSTVLDAYTKQVLAYVVSDSLKEDFVLETMEQLMQKHGSTIKTDKTVINSDQGPHYTNVRFSELVRDKSLRQSMSRKANCWDNAPMESFYGHMKDAVEDRVSRCETFEEVRAVIDDYVDYYNNDRFDWDLAKLSPNEFYEFCTTGVYPLKVPAPDISFDRFKDPDEMGKKK